MIRRSQLYVPGDRPELMLKAMAGPAHAVILDLEDGVSPSQKDAARLHVLRHLEMTRADRARPDAAVALVRVDPSHLAADLAVATRGGADGIVLAKATAESVEHAASLLDQLEADLQIPTATPTPITALIESARGVLDAPTIAEALRVEVLSIGEADLAAELGIIAGPQGSELAPLRMSIVVASAAAGLRAPNGPVSVDFADLDAFRASCELLRRIGFGARSAIHPAQVPIINEVFAPSAAEIANARTVIDAFDRAVAAGRGVTVGDDGTMIDEAVVRSARRVLDLG